MALFLAMMLSLLGGQALAADWQLVWSDEFKYQGLPDPQKWNYEEGFVRNHESQYYTKARLENARVENGLLVIEGRKEHYEPPGHAAVEYTSASLTTKGLEAFKYGRIEMRAKLPQGKGMWPAFWTLGTNIDQVGWPGCGEDDIMEFVGKDTNHIYGTLHFAVDGKHASDGGKVELSVPYNDFHVYAVEWSPTRIDFFVDDHKYHSVEIEKAGAGDDNPFRKPHYLLLNLALGGDWGGPIEDELLPQKYLINYVRVYQRTDAAGGR
jgi:beta-glucanase (GH16 family)